MSFRPTIAVYINGTIADIGYYRNWSTKCLLYEALAIAALYGDCRTAEAYRERRYHRQQLQYLVEPELFDNSEENLKFFESCSELPLVVDLTAQCIYCSAGALTVEEIQKLPSALAMLPFYGSKTVYRRCRNGSFCCEEKPVTAYRRISKRTDFYYLLKNCRLPYGELDMTSLLTLFRTEPSLRRFLSEDIADQLDRVS